MKVIKFESDWETIYQYINRAIKYAIEHNVNCECEFNEGEFIVTPQSTERTAYIDWQNAMHKKEEEYKKSDEYKQRQQEREDKKNKMNREVAILFDRFNSLDLNPTTYSGMKAMLDWFAEYQDYSDCILCTDSNDKYVVDKLKEHGYIKNKWVGADKEIMDDMMCNFEFIVGQAIATMEFLAMHQSIIVFRNRWVEQFGKTM